MKKTLITIAIIALSITLKAQQTNQLPKTVTINTSDLIGLYARLDTLTNFLQSSELKGSQITLIGQLIQRRILPLNATLTRRIQFVADSTKKAATIKK